MGTRDTLSERDLEQFYRLKHSLYLFADKQLNILNHREDWMDVAKNPPEKIMRVRDHIFEENIGLIDQFVSEESDNLTREDIGIVKEWKHAIIGRKFILVKHTKEHSLFFGNDKVYGVIGLMDSFNDLFGGHAPVFLDLIILPFKGRLTHEGILIPYNVSIGKSMAKSLIAEAEEVMHKRGVIDSIHAKEKESSDEDLLRFYMKSRTNRDKFCEEIEQMRQKSHELNALYNYEMGRVNARQVKKQLKAHGIKGHFGILFSEVVASGRTKGELEENTRRMVPEDKLKEIYHISIK